MNARIGAQKSPLRRAIGGRQISSTVFFSDAQLHAWTLRGGAGWASLLPQLAGTNNLTVVAGTAFIVLVVPLMTAAHCFAVFSFCSNPHIN